MDEITLDSWVSGRENGENPATCHPIGLFGGILAANGRDDFHIFSMYFLFCMLLGASKWSPGMIFPCIFSVMRSEILRTPESSKIITFLGDV